MTPEEFISSLLDESVWNFIRKTQAYRGLKGTKHKRQVCFDYLNVRLVERYPNVHPSVRGSFGDEDPDARRWAEINR